MTATPIGQCDMFGRNPLARWELKLAGIVGYLQPWTDASAGHPHLADPDKHATLRGLLQSLEQRVSSVGHRIVAHIQRHPSAGHDPATTQEIERELTDLLQAAERLDTLLREQQRVRRQLHS